MKKLLYPNINAELARGGLTVVMLAEFMGMSAQNLYKKLNGAINITEKDMKAIQNFFEVKECGTFTLDYLFTTNN